MSNCWEMVSRRVSRFEGSFWMEIAGQQAGLETIGSWHTNKANR